MSCESAMARSDYKILLVEDEASVKELTKRMLEQQGYEVIATTSPNKAISLAKDFTGKIHLMIVDVVMPEMTGRELSKNLQSLRPDLKLLLMSGYTADVIAHHGILDENIHFIQKPFSSKKLAGKIQEALND